MTVPGVVGRDSELAEVDRFLDEIGSGFAALVVQGEPGIGKTTIWREARRRAGQRGMTVLTCRPAMAEAKLSFAAVGDLLSGVDQAAFDGLPDLQSEALEVALLRKAPSRRASLARAVAAGFLGLVRALAAERSVLVAVDDWQWLDGSSRRVLEFVARRLESERIGLVCSLRGPASTPLAGVVAEERLGLVDLGSLSLAALGRIVTARLRHSLPRPLLVRISQASRGNPFYALEIARMTSGREAHPAPSALPVPDDLRQLTASRIDRLPAATRDAVLLAAALSSPDSTIVDVGALAPAEAAGILRVDEAGRIEFAHPLFASAAYGSIPIAQRRALHHRAAELDADPEQRARHLALGADGTDAVVAQQLDDAATLAAARGAPDAAAELAELAADLTPALDGHRHAERLFAAAQFQFDAGDLAQAEAVAHRVQAASPPGVLRARALELITQLRSRRNNFADASEVANAALQAAGDDHRLRAAIELDLVHCAVSLGDLGSGEAHARAAVSDAQASGESGILGDALAVRTMAEFLAGRGLDHAALARALELEDPEGASAFIMRPRVISGMLKLWSGELDSAIGELTSVYAETIHRGLEGSAPMLYLYLVWAHVWQGSFQEAAHLSDEARDAAGLLEDPVTAGLALSASALVHAHVGPTAPVRTEVEEAIEQFDRARWRSGMIWPLWALGLLLLSEGDPVGVDRALGPLTETLAAMGAGDPVMATFLPDEVEALVAMGELDRAEAILEPFAASASKLDRAWAIAAAERCRGALAGARGEREAAFAGFERALAAHDCSPMPFERARTLLLAGQVYRRFKQRARARDALTKALATFEEVGAALWAAQARRELRRVGQRGPGGDELTETERRLADLAAAGLSNREVAERAFVSVKTVEANLTRVYRKLGVKSRVGLANALREGPHSEPAPRPPAKHQP